MFTLINKNGATLDIVQKRRFAFDVSGMGYERRSEYVQVGDHYIPTDISYSQGKIGGEMRFSTDAYTSLYSFLRFADEYPLKLKYTNPNGTFYRDVIVSTVDRSELLTDEPKEISFELTTLGLWYRPVQMINTDDVGAGSKTYSYTYPYRYGQEPGRVVISSDTPEDSPAKLTIYGPVYWPRWVHYANGGLVSSGRVLVSLLENQKLVVNALTIPYSIGVYDMSNQLIEDVYDLSDFSTERFIHLKKGNNSITEQDGAKIALEGRLYYGAV